MASRLNGGNGEPLDRFLKRMIARWDAGLARIDALERRQDQMMKVLLRREQRDQERWQEQKERWHQQQRLWSGQGKHWEAHEKRWEETQKLLHEILARLPKA
jgi:hypothetical protein